MEEYRLYLNGQWIDTENRLDVVDPGSGESITTVPQVGASETRSAIETAQAALPAWRRMTARDRGDLLLAVADRLESRKNEISRVITLENGKPLAQSLGEIAVSVDHFRWFAEEGRRAYGRVIPHQADGKRHLVIKHPVGVVGAIPPWNFPLVLSARKVAPALAAGCPVVLKPSRETPLCALELARCAEEAGLPGGVFQVVVGPSEEIVGEMMDNPGCSKITFTGSTAVGKELIKTSAATVTRISLELGGHAPVLVFADADMDLAVEGAMITKFRNTGQSCIASNRIYVERSVYPQFLESFAAAASRLKTGYGLDEGVDIGAMINRDALDNAVAQIEDAAGRGAQVVCGGKVLEQGSGLFLEPTILSHVDSRAVCMHEETFAPIAPVVPFDTEEEAVGQANDTRYGLAAYTFTSDVSRAWRLAEALEAGSICVNDAVPSTSNAPFGGMKESGYGRELGSEGMEAFLETKHICFGGI